MGATNVAWVWSPHILYGTRRTIQEYYPGDAYVDWVAMDGYNWGVGSAKPDVWRSFGEVFGPTYRELTRIAPAKRIMIAEVATTELGGSKAAWIADALSTLPTAFPRVRAFVWFNWDTDGMDWRIESSRAAQASFARGIPARGTSRRAALRSPRPS